MVNIVIGLRHAEPHIKGDVQGMYDMVRTADRKGLFGIEISDHVLMAEKVNYPYGAPKIEGKTYFYEPLTMLAAYAAITERVRFSTHIMVAPVRSAVFLAKQIATLDLIANGRLDLGLGAGWQKEEFDVTPGAPWDTRFGYMDEQVKVCRTLWAGGPAQFEGKYHKFERFYAYPLPMQGANVPIYYGIRPTERNVMRMGELGVGWMPEPGIATPETLAPHVAALRASYKANGRDPETLKIGVMVPPLKSNESDQYCDLAATLAQIPALVEAGMTMAQMYPFNYGPISDYDGFIDALVAAQKKS